MADPVSLSVAQLRALAGVTARELFSIMPRVACELRVWRAAALRIPDPGLRVHALSTMKRERLNIEGAALISTLTPGAPPHLLSLLVAFQIALDYLDTVSEHLEVAGGGASRRMHHALFDALAPAAPLRDYRRDGPPGGDGGYLRALVAACRWVCARLPAYRLIAPLALSHASRLGVQAYNHDPHPDRRRRMLASWVAHEVPGHPDFTAFELAAGASNTLMIHVLLALAADERLTADEARSVDGAYFPWICAAGTLLDSFVDQASDASVAAHNYMAYYDSSAAAAQRIRELVFEAVTRARALPRGTHHALLVSGMVAMYLSHDAAWSPELREASREISRAAGSLQRVQLPILRAMRAIHGLRAA